MFADEPYGWTFLRTSGRWRTFRRLFGNGLGRYPVWHPDSRRFLRRGRSAATCRHLRHPNQPPFGDAVPVDHGRALDVRQSEGPHPGRALAPDQTEFDPADTAIPASLKEQIVYVALLDDGSQVTLSPDEFAAKFGWQNDPNQAYLLGPRRDMLCGGLPLRLCCGLPTAARARPPVSQNRGRDSAVHGAWHERPTHRNSPVAQVLEPIPHFPCG